MSSSNDNREDSSIGSASEESDNGRNVGASRRVSTHGHLSTSPPKRSRKRVRRSSAWKKNLRKRLRNAGERYVSDTTNSTVSARSLVMSK